MSSATNTLQGAIGEFIEVCLSVTGIRRAPRDPEEQINIWPVAMAYAATGNFATEPAGEFTGLHDVQIAVLMPLQSLRLCTQIILPFVESVPEALYEHRNQRLSQHYETFADIDYTLGPIEWVPELYMYGIVFTIRGLKILNTVAIA